MKLDNATQSNFVKNKNGFSVYRLAVQIDPYSPLAEAMEITAWRDLDYKAQRDLYELLKDGECHTIRIKRSVDHVVSKNRPVLQLSIEAELSLVEQVAGNKQSVVDYSVMDMYTLYNTAVLEIRNRIRRELPSWLKRLVK